MLNPKKWATTLLNRLRRKERSDTASTLTTEKLDAAELQRWMQSHIGEALNISGESVDVNKPIASYGLDSIAAFTLTLALAERLDRDLPASLLWDYPTIAEMAQFLSENEES